MIPTRADSVVVVAYCGEVYCEVWCRSPRMTVVPCRVRYASHSKFSLHKHVNHLHFSGTDYRMMLSAAQE